MSKQNVLTKKQLNVIDALAKGYALSGILKRNHISPTTFHRWFASEAFERELGFRHALMQRQSALLLDQNACKAAKNLIKLMNNKDKPDIARRACLDVLNLINNEQPTNAFATSEPATVTMDQDTAGEVLKLLSKESKKP